MAKITRFLIEKAYEEAKLVHNGQKNQTDAQDYLENQGLNRNSAGDLISNFRCMVDGQKFTRTNNAETTEYYLKHILKDYGEPTLINALSALEEHIEYYEDLQSIKMHKVRAIFKDFKKKVNSISLNTLIQDETNKINKASIDLQAQRIARIKLANKNPKKIIVYSYTYERNADIVAEALYRANGTCEKCHKKAPFIRKSNKTPYLEVHHIKQLSKGGDDSLQNVLALCPNCHRELHHA